MDFLNFLEPPLLQKILRIVGISIFALFVIRLSKKSVQVFFENLARPSHSFTRKNRLDTIRSITENVVSTVIIVVVILQIAADFGFNILPFITGASLIGLAVSFGSQTLIKDVISGFFLLIDNQINIGDSVKIADTRGKILHISMRVITMEDEAGNTVYIPNSEVKKIVIYQQKNTKKDKF